MDAVLIDINGTLYRLLLTCRACPEQYDVYDALTGAEVGYLRLRHGHFTARYPNVAGGVVFDGHPCGDGVFNDDERLGFLNAAVAALDAQRLDEKP